MSPVLGPEVREDAEYLRLLAQEVSALFFDYVSHLDESSWGDYFNVVTACTLGKFRQGLLALGEKARAAGASRPITGIKNLEGPMREAFGEFINSVDHIGVSALGAARAAFPATAMTQWADLNPAIVARWATDGAFGAGTGRLGTGKTNVACIVAEEYLKLFPDARVFTNIRTEPVDRVLYVSSLSQLLGHVDGTPFLFIFDEAAVSGFSTMDATTVESKGLNKFFRVFRKLGGAMFIIEQREANIPTHLKDWIVFLVECKSPGLVRMVSDGKIRTVTGVPRARAVRFDTLAIADFEVDLDVPALFERIRDSPDVYAAIREYLGELQAAREKTLESARLCTVCSLPLPPETHRNRLVHEGSCERKRHAEVVRGGADKTEKNVDKIMLSGHQSGTESVPSTENVVRGGKGQ
jgi:hypothetical protein